MRRPSMPLISPRPSIGFAQRVHGAAEIAVADGHGEHFAGASDLLAFLDACEIAEDNHADLTGVKVERQAERAVLEGQQLVGHATRQSRHMRNAVASRGHIAHLLGGSVRRRVRLDELIERLAYRGGINGKFCHDHSLLCFVLTGKSCQSQACALTVRCSFCSCATTVLSVTSSPTWMRMPPMTLASTTELMCTLRPTLAE